MQWEGKAGPTDDVDTKVYSIANKLIEVVANPKFGTGYDKKETAEAPTPQKGGGKGAGAKGGKGGKSSAVTTPAGTPRKNGAAAEAGSAAPTPQTGRGGATTPGGGKKDKKEKQSSVNDKMWELREHTHGREGGGLNGSSRDTLIRTRVRMYVTQ